MERPTIFVFTTAYHPLIGGAEIAIQEIMKRLAPEFRFVVITARLRSELPAVEERPEGMVYRIGFGSWLDKFLLPVWGSVRVLGLVRRERPILFWPVMVSFASGIPYLVNIIRFWGRIPVLLTLQEGDSPAHIARGRFGLIGLAWRFALARADFVQVISRYLANLARVYGYRGEIKVIPNGVNLQAFSNPLSTAEREQLRTTLGVRLDGTLVITTSRLEAKNGIDTLIRGFALLRARRQAVKLLILGDGSERRKLESLARALKVYDAIRFLGSVPNAEVPRHLLSADIFCRPSRSEGLGVSFIEAMAAGLPVIAPPIGGIPDFLRDGENGLFVRVDDSEDLAAKLELVIQDSKRRSMLAKSARETARRGYDWANLAPQFSKIFRRFAATALPTPRILIATGIFPPDIGGPATHAAMIISDLPARGFSISLITYADSRVDARDAQDAVVRVSRSIPRGLRHFSYFWQCVRLARNADIIYALDPVSAGLPAIAAAKILRRRLVLRIAGDYAWEQGVSRFGVRELLDEFQLHRYGWQVELLRSVERRVALSADLIIAPSQYLRGVIAGWGIPSERILVVENAVDIPADLPTRAAARRSLGIAPGTELVLSAGRLVPWKGFDALIRMMPELIKRRLLAKLLIVGDGPERGHLTESVRALALGGKVTLVGAVGRATLAAYLRAADCFVLATSYEGFPHQIIEAQAVGVPVITTAISGNREVVRDGATGILFPLGDDAALLAAVGRVLGDPELRASLAVAGARSNLRFTRAAMLDKLTACFRHVLA